MDEQQDQPGSQRSGTTIVDLPGLAAQEVRQVVIFTGDFVTTVVTLVSSALSLVAALAWNNFVQSWLPTVNWLNLRDPIIKELVYALAVTAFAVTSVTVLTSIRKRLKGRDVFKL